MCRLILTKINQLLKLFCMKKVIILFALSIHFATWASAQSVGVGTTSPDPSALLELKATDKGFLPPRMTGAQKILIPSPKPGLMIYQTDGITGLYIYNGVSWSVAGAAAGNSWSVNGNAGTLPASNFIGTTDNQPLKFRVNNLAAGEINPASANVAFGYHSMESIQSGAQNTAVGFNSLAKNISGHDNTAIGLAALYSNTTGGQNSAFGTGVLASNTSGDLNVGTGVNSLTNNISGNGNIAIGAYTLNFNQSGYQNVAMGTHASYSNVSGNYIVAIGDSALFHNTMSSNMAIGSKALFGNSTGVSNTAVGGQSLYNNTVGSQNTAVGRVAMFNNISGIQNIAVGYQALKTNQSGNRNSAIGFQSLLFNTIGSDNTGLGFGSLANTTADGNTGIGSSALLNNTSGISNTAVGTNALATNVTGSSNTAIGDGADIYGTNYTNATAVGANAQVACSNCLVLGSVKGYNGATVDSRVGIGTTNPQKTLHVSPNGFGGILIGNNLTTGGYTALNMGISQESGGYTYLQAVKAAGTPTSVYGSLVLNQYGGNVGIRTTTPLALLHIKQNIDEYPVIDGGIRLERHDNSAHWDIGADNSSDLSFSFNGSSKFYFDDVDGDITIVSDLRMKKDIKTVKAVLPDIMKLQAKSYHYIDNDKDARLSYGFIAQEMEQIFPDLVSTKGVNGMKAIGYQKLNVIAIQAIQEQQAIIEEQQKRITSLENKLDALLKAIGK